MIFSRHLILIGCNRLFNAQKEAFIQTIKDNEGIIYKITRVYAKDTEDQKDLYQEIVYQLWKSFDSFKGKSKLSTWMYRVALNTSIAHLNQNKRRPLSTSVVSLNFESLDVADPSSITGSEWDDRMHILYEHIKRLNVIEKGLILLFLEGNSYEEIAIITGFTTTNVGTRLGRIKQKLKTNIKK